MVEEGLLLWRNPPSDQMFTVTCWCIADNTCIYLNPVILVVFFLTELFAVGYQVSDKRPWGLYLTCDLDLNLWPIYLESLTFAIALEPLEIGLLYFICIFFLMRPFRSYHRSKAPHRNHFVPHLSVSCWRCMHFASNFYAVCIGFTLRNKTAPVLFCFTRCDRIYPGKGQSGWQTIRHTTRFVFFRPIGKTRWPPWRLIGWDIFSTSLKSLNGIQWNKTISKISTSPTKFVFFRPIGKTRLPHDPQTLIGWDIFDFSFETAERKLYR